MESECLLKPSQCKTLPELFYAWKQKHNSDTDTNTFPKDKNGNSPDLKDFRDSFCRDGVTSLTERVPIEVDPKVHILFILKEADVKDDEGNLQRETGDYFWFNCSRKYPRTRYGNAIKFYMDKLNEDTNQRFGYMNLNKRGGYGQTNPSSLKSYVDEYRCFIKRQIEIMNPDIVVCCGCFGNVMNVFEKSITGKKQRIKLKDKDVWFYDVYHPAYSRYKESGNVLVT